MIKKIVFVSPFKSESHIELEARIIESYSKIYHQNDCRLYFMGGAEHIEKVLSVCNPKIPIKRIICVKKIPYFMSQIFYFLILGKSIKIHLAYDPWILGIRSMIIILIFRFDFIFMHGYYLEINHRLKHLFHLVVFKKSILAEKTKIITLGEWIYEYIQKDINLTKYQKENIFWIQHPIILKKDKEKSNNKIIFGLLGNQNMTQKKIKNRNVIKMEEKIKNRGHVMMHGGEKFISREDYLKILYKSDYILNFSEGYKYRCSGVLTEVIALGKPIVGIKNSMLDFFQKKVGSIGYIKSNINDIDISLIEKDFFEREKYFEHKKNIHKIGIKNNNFKIITNQLMKIGLKKI